MRGIGNARAGVTLVELLIASAVSLVVGIAVAAAFLSGQRSFIVGTNAVELHGDARVAMTYLGRDIKWAREIIAVQAPYTTAFDELILSIPAIDAPPNSNIIPGIFDTVVYRMPPATPTNLERIVIPGAGSSRQLDAKNVANDVSALVFTVPGSNPAVAPTPASNAIAVTLTLQKVLADGRTITETVRSTFSLRNFE